MSCLLGKPVARRASLGLRGTVIVGPKPYSAACRVPAGLALAFCAALAFSGALAFALTGLAASLAARGWVRGGFSVDVPRLILGLRGPLATRSAINCTASSMVRAAGSLPLGSVALTSACLT